MTTKPQAPQGATKRKPPPTIDELSKCAEGGLTRLQTAKKCKCSYQMVCRLANRYDIAFTDAVRGAKPKKGDRVRFLLMPFMNEAIDGIDVAGVAKAVGVSKQYIYKVVREMKEAIK